MTAKTPKHGDLVAAVADLSPRKVEKFAIALGVPKNVVEESQINNPKDIDRVKLDALDWWIRNENASWEAIAKALEARGVDERNLAKRIRSSGGLDSAEDGKLIWAEKINQDFFKPSRDTGQCIFLPDPERRIKLLINDTRPRTVLWNTCIYKLRMQWLKSW